MGKCKEIIIKVIPASVANPFVKAHHYSGKVVPNSQLHFGAFLDGKLHGVLSYGCSMDKRKTMALVKDTGWNEFLELNRMAFDDYLPRNSESYCIGATLRMIRKQAPQIKWVISFADGCSCGDGTIYRASNFILTDIRENHNLCELPNGEKIHKMTLESQPTIPRKELNGKCYAEITGGGEQLPQIRAICWRQGFAWLSTAICLFSRQGEPLKTDGARVAIFGNRRNGRGLIQKRAYKP